MKTGRRLSELFSFPDFVAAAALKGVFGDPGARIVSLRRRKKRPCANCGHRCRSRYDQRVCRTRDLRVAGRCAVVWINEASQGGTRPAIAPSMRLRFPATGILRLEPLPNDPSNRSRSPKSDTGAHGADRNRCGRLGLGRAGAGGDRRGQRVRAGLDARCRRIRNSCTTGT